MGELLLNFRQIGDPRGQSGYKVDWPFSDKPLLWAEIRSNAWGMVGSIAKRFAIANIPQGHRVFFGATIDKEHTDLKLLLTSSGDEYREIREVVGTKTVGRNLFEILTFGRRVPDTVFTLIGSTGRTEVIELLFDRYKFYWTTFYIFTFVVAKEEPPNWAEELAEFLKVIRQDPHTVSANMIESSRCIMLTQLDHGIDFVSTKVSRSEVEHTAKNIAAEHSLQLMVRERPSQIHLGSTRLATDSSNNINMLFSSCH